MKQHQQAALQIFALAVALAYVLARVALPPEVSAPAEPWHPQPEAFVQQEPAQPALDLDRLYLALAEVESKGDPMAWNPRENAAGVLQIRPIMVDDLNRIAGYRRWRIDARWDPDYSRAMLGEYLDHYGAASYEEAARKWNGGPDGHTEEATVPYWEKVRKALK